MKARALVLAATLVPATLVAATQPAPKPAPCTAADLFRDDFSSFPPGWLWAPIGQLNGAIQEYHYLPHRGVPLGAWSNPIAHLDAWVVSDEDGKSYLEQHLVYELVAQSNPLFITGDAEWTDVTVEASVRPLSLAHKAGIVLRYHTNRSFLSFVLTEGKTARLLERITPEPSFRVAGEKERGVAAFPYDSKKYYRMRVEDRAGHVRAFIDDKLVLEADVTPTRGGKTGVVANIPARFQDFRVSTCADNKAAIEKRIAAREAELTKLRAGNPQPKLWKKFDTPKFGAGRNVRFGDLDGDGTPEMLIAQNIMRVRGDAFDHISAMTAVSLDGKILWQLGRPDPRNTLLTNDTPFQIHDIDGDGKNDIVMIRDFKLQILDGATGKVKHWAWQTATAAEDKPPYELNSGDCITFMDADGSGARRHIVLKDRYKRFWVYNNKLEKLWEGQTNSGHYPYPVDVDGDKKEELLIGYSLFSGDGKRLWDRDDVLDDHADGGAFGNFTDDPKAPARVYWVGSDEGFIVADKDGKILQHQRIGHGQNLTVAKLRPEMPGLQLLTVNFWKSVGIVSLFDPDGKLLAQDEPIHSGSELLPVNWRGDGQEFALLSGNIREGGMIDGQLRRVVMFPDDGHPDLAAQVLDLTGDARDEVVLWDTERVWIYTQDRPFTGDKIYAPQRNPRYNDSNYRANVSMPGWKPTK
jgi:rhamnogalacturonan endolyase